jgi:plastocyanin
MVKILIEIDDLLPGFIHLRFPVIILALVLTAAASTGCTGAGGNPAAKPSPAAVSASPTVVQTATIELTAAKMTFDRKVITVPAGADVVVNFHNLEPSGSSQVTGMAHNFAVYDSPASRTKIFSGAIVTGGQNITYRFTAPAVPGIYFFRCDVHPLLINGTFMVR